MPSRCRPFCKGEVITGWQNKLRAAIALVTPADFLAEQHHGMAEPGTSDKVASARDNRA
ncbi:hypothetical protein [Cupriavidus pinatubonensis]|uniref:hypothetical protein n=1 Tax=Cupriavidus pinatubonensis TaxID=248026 RepID=UPI0015E432DA|nr:hypothetical protein [Cupriavidus pinatubonensis]